MENPIRQIFVQKLDIEAFETRNQMAVSLPFFFFLALMFALTSCERVIL
jgi:hypothetical protein